MWFNKKEIKEEDRLKKLQVRLKALVNTCIAKQYMDSSDEDEYRKLLEEIYTLNAEPCITIVHKNYETK